MSQVRTPKDAVELIHKFRPPHEAIPTDVKANREVWQAMLEEGMPMTAMVRNLANMTRYGVLTPTSKGTEAVRDQLLDTEHIAKSRIHPFQILMAAKTYAAGRGMRGQNTWVPIPYILDALDEAFYMAFENIPRTGLSRMIGLDISGSMWGGMVAGTPGLSPAVGAGAMAMCSVRSGDPYEVTAFTSARGYSYYDYGRYNQAIEGLNEPLPGLSVHNISAKTRLDDLEGYMRQLARYMGGTNPSLVMQYAQQAEREVDVFEIYTDAEAWAGDRHACQALWDYRKASGIAARLIVIGMVPNKFTVADPRDAGMLDVVGFDTATPQLIADFAAGELG
jgi:60 kDa SS-A/Ro ribonucleoprotein